MTGLGCGDLPPRIVTPPPGARARRFADSLARSEAPGVNTLGAKLPILWQEAVGANVLDVDGNVYVDLTSGFGVAAVGHRHPAVVAAIQHQSGILLNALGDVNAHPLRCQLADRLCRLAPVDDAQVFFTCSGAEAVEVALKTACLATGLPGVLAFRPAYHGSTLGALAVTSREEFRAPFAAQLNPHVVRVDHGGPLAQVEEALAGRPEVGCVLFEPVVGREGTLFPPVGWLTAIADLCRRRGLLLVADEVFTGFGRTGRWFAVDHEGVRPDLLCCGKALGGGLPISALLARRPLMAAWATRGEALHTSTFLANPVACAAALAVLEILEHSQLPARAATLEPFVAARLAPWPTRFSQVDAVRGRGLLWGVELDRREAATSLVAGALARGVIALAGGPEGRVVQVAPPLTISEPQLIAAIAALESALSDGST